MTFVACDVAVTDRPYSLVQSLLAGRIPHPASLDLQSDNSLNLYARGVKGSRTLYCGLFSKQTRRCHTAASTLHKVGAERSCNLITAYYRTDDYLLVIEQK